MDTLLADLRYALRQLARSPGFTAVAVLTLALGAGTNSLLFSVIHAVLLRPLPYPDPDRIVSIGLVPRDNTIGRMDAQATHWAYFEWGDDSRSFAELAAYISEARAIVGGGSAPVDMRGAEVSAGVSITHTLTELTGLLSRSSAQPPFLRDASVDVVSLQERLYGSTRPLLLILLGAVGFVLLIACANVASLLVARAARREREFAIRAALGAGRLRMVRQLLAESVVLAALGAAAGLLVPVLGLRLVIHAAPFAALQAVEVHLDASVLAFTTGVALLTGIAFGVAPAVPASQPQLVDGL